MKVEEVVEKIVERFGPGSAFTLSDSDVPCNVKEWVSTGLLGVDLAIGRPGIPI